MLDRPLQQWAARSGPHRLFFVGQPHLKRLASVCRMESRVLDSIDPAWREPMNRHSPYG
jgi:hypothetical protein